MRSQSLYLLHLSYGVLAGTGGGMGYICPVATVAKWLPDQRGVMTGLAVTGYRAGALLRGPIAARQIVSIGGPTPFFIFRIAYCIGAVVTGQFYANPPARRKPEGWVPKTAVAKAAGTYESTVKEAVGTWQVWALWLMLFFNVSADIMIISQASPIAQQQAHMRAIAAGKMVGLFGIFNAAGRFPWARVSDYFGRAWVYFVLYLIQAGIFFVPPRIDTETAVFVTFAVIHLG